MKAGELRSPKRESLGMFLNIEKMKEALIDSHRYGAWSCEWTTHPEDVFMVLHATSFGHPVFANDPVPAVRVLTRKGVFWTWEHELT
jgi:hypothetical protein